MRFASLPVAVLVLVVTLLLIYAPDVGHGFISDDFAWLEHGHLARGSDVARLFSQANGFYRPLVSMSFGVDRWFFGLNPLGYGLTNLALLLACAAGVFALLRQVGATPPSAVIGAAAWAFNLHGINMAVLWISGRTALLLTLTAVLAARASLRGRRWEAALWCLAALLSKEEAVVLPVVLLAWEYLRAPSLSPSPVPSMLDRLVLASWRTWPAFVALGTYAALRAPSGAFTAATAPVFYRFTSRPDVVVRNVLEYVDRSWTASALVLVLLIATIGRLPRASEVDWRRVQQGSVWWIAGFSITVWLPVRSSLYAVFPSVGSVLVLTALIDPFLTVPTRRLRRVLAYGVLVPLLLLPIYRARNQRWVQLADLSAHVLSTLGADAASIPRGRAIVLEDDQRSRTNAAAAFATLYPQAARLFLDGEHRLWIEPPPGEHAGESRPDGPVVRYVLDGGKVRKGGP